MLYIMIKLTHSKFFFVDACRWYWENVRVSNTLLAYIRSHGHIGTWQRHLSGIASITFGWRTYCVTHGCQVRLYQMHI